MKKCLLVYCVLMIFFLISSACRQRANGEELPQIILLQTADYMFKDKWYHTLSGSVPKLIMCDTVFKQQHFYIAPVAVNYQLDKTNRANVWYSVKIFRPDRSVYITYDNLPLVNRQIEDKNNLQLSDSVLTVCFNENDPLGTYKIQIEVTDKVARKTIKEQSEVVLARLPDYGSLLVRSYDDFVEWMIRYYESPAPEQTLSYYLFLTKQNLAVDDRAFVSSFYTFLEILNNNHFLYPQIISCYESQDLKTRIYLLYLLAFSNIDVTDFFGKLEEVEKFTFGKMQEMPKPSLYDTIREPVQIDMLWSTFMANGSYLPVLKLIRTLEYTKYRGALDDYATSAKTKEDAQRALLDAVYDRLLWSFESNCEYHTLVADYCHWAYEYENLTDVQRDELGKILFRMDDE